MLNQFQEPESELRQDGGMQKFVVERAARLQQEDQDRQTIHQIVDAALEVGLEPHFVERAIAEFHAHRGMTAVVGTKAKRSMSHHQAEYRRFVTAMTAPMGLGALAFAFKDATSIAVLLSLVLPAPLACLSGFLTGRKRVGAVTAALFILALAPTAYHLGIHEYYRENANRIYEAAFEQYARQEGSTNALNYLFFGTPLAMLLGAFGGWTRQRYLQQETDSQSVLGGK